MNRYLNSFFITLFVYVTLGSFSFWFFKKDFIKPKEQTKTIFLNNLAILETPKVEIQEKEKISENPQLSSFEKPKIKEKEPKPTLKSPIKNKKEKKVVKKIEKNNSEITAKIEKDKQENKQEKILQESNITSQKEVEKPIKVDEGKVYLDKYLSQIREKINKNVTYPSKAKKLLIEGIVIVKFKIFENGTVGDIIIINGNSFLHNSTIQAIKDASLEFPKVPKELEIELPIEYKLI